MKREGNLSTWQDWIILLIYITLVVYIFIKIDSNSHSVSDTLINFIPLTFILTIFLIIIFYLKNNKSK